MPEQINTSQTLPEVEENRRSYVSRLRSAVANEMKLSFTLPKPFEGVLRDLAVKGIGVANLGVTGYAQMQENSGLSHEVVLKNHGSAVAAAIGAACILGANLMRKLDQRQAEEWNSEQLVSQVPKTQAPV